MAQVYSLLVSTYFLYTYLTPRSVVRIQYSLFIAYYSSKAPRYGFT